MSLQSQPKLAIVTGASSGIGASTAHALAERGMRVALIARDTDKLQHVADDLPTQVEPIIVSCDLSDVERIGDHLSPVVDRFGPPDVLVNNAGAGSYQPFLATTAGDHRRSFDLHYHAAAALIRLVLPGMLEAGRGHVINVASISTKVGPWGHSAYTPSKAALASLTETLAAEYHERGVRFSVVKPGIVRTGFFDSPALGRLWRRVSKHAIEPQDVARTIVRLIDRPRIEACFPRSHRVLDWIRAVSPTWACRLVARSSRPARSTEPADLPPQVQAEPMPNASTSTTTVH